MESMPLQESLDVFSITTLQAVVSIACIFIVLALRQYWFSNLKPHKRGDQCFAETGETDFQESLDVAYKSALTKFDSLSAYFSKGMTFDAVVSMLVDEISSDQDFAHLLSPGGVRNKAFMRFVKENVGRALSTWKKSRSGMENASEGPENESAFLSWSSIENYPEWVHDQINLYLTASKDEEQLVRVELERALLETPLMSVSTKYDGTCFGKMDNGVLVGRRQVVGAVCQIYQHTSTAAVRTCDVEGLKDALSKMLRINLEPGSVCVWGELMCNPGYYNYQSRGLHEKWLPFGVVLQVPEATELDSFICGLEREGLAYSAGQNRKFRLSLCPALRRLLQDVGKCQVVEETFSEGTLTHAEVVTKGAEELMKGNNEGMVLAFPRRRGEAQASLRKWKNSSEGQGASKKHAERLRRLQVRQLAQAGRLDTRIADMVDTLIAVAESETQVQKTGRKAAMSKAR